MGESKTSMNIDPSRSLSGPSLTVVNSRLYASWREPDAAGVGQVRVAVYNGDDGAPAWTLVDRKVNGSPRTPQQGINANPNFSVISNLAFVAVGDWLYASWIENGCVRVSRYNGNDAAPEWTFVDFGASGVNYSGAKEADGPRLVSFNNELFVFWREAGPAVKGSSPYQVRGRKYSGTTGWSWVDGGKATGLNVDPTKGIWSLRPVVMNDEALYLGFGEVVVNGSRKNPPKSALRVKRYLLDSNSWELVDGGSGAAFGRRVASICSGADASGVYFAWQDELVTSDNYVDRWPLRVSYYNAADDAPEWSQLDDPDTQGTIQFDPSRSASPMRLTQFDNRLIFTWSEWGMYAAPGQPQLRARGWDGVDWTWMDGGVGDSSALHQEPGSEGNGLHLVPFNGKLYKFTSESLGGPNQGFVAVGLQE
jgi:hypothetical protein